MKTQIIQLNNNDDVISVRDKMGWNQTNRLLLVLPKNVRVIHRKLDLNLIKRHAGLIGSQIALVTRHPEVRYNAHLLGIPVFSTIHAAQDTEWRIPREIKKTQNIKRTHPLLDSVLHQRNPPGELWQSHTAVRIISFVISLLALLAMGLVLLPGAKITITPQTLTQSKIVPVTADPSLSKVNHSTSSLPVDTLEVIVEGGLSAKVTGTTKIPDKFSTGTIRLKNISDHLVSVPQTTKLITQGDEPVRFFITTNRTISLAPGSSVDVGIKAEVPGTTGNLPPDSLVAIEGDAGINLTATNPQPTSGGTDALVPSPDSRDYELLRSLLLEKLENQVLEELRAQVPEKDTLISPSVKIVEVLEEKISPDLGEPGNQIELFMIIKYESQVVREETIKSLVEPILATSFQPGYIPYKNDLLLINETDPILGEGGKSHWKIRVEQKLQSEILLQQIVNQIKGMSKKAAEELLSISLPQADNIQISITPKWWPRLPYLAMRINVIQIEPK